MHDEAWVTNTMLPLTKPPHFTQSQNFSGLIANKSHTTSLVTGTQVQTDAAKGLFCIQRLSLLTLNCLPGVGINLLFWWLSPISLAMKSPGLSSSTYLWGISLPVHKRKEILLFKNGDLFCLFVLDSTCKWNHTVFVFVYFTEHKTLWFIHLSQNKTKRDS